MKVWQRPNEAAQTTGPIAAALGLFDGAHLGHQHVIRQTVLEAQLNRGLSLVITFDPHPLSVLFPDKAPRLLQTLPQRLRTFEQLGVDAALVLPFTHEFSQLTGANFIQSLVKDLARLRSLTVGRGFFFGHLRSGNVALLQSLGSTLGFQVNEVAPFQIGSEIVSSTRVRAALRSGDLTHVAALLGRPYTLSGKVLEGDGIGRQLGFPTANINVSGLELPPHGVYAAWTHWNNQKIASAVNLGLRPTLRSPNPELRFEVHLLTDPQGSPCSTPDSTPDSTSHSRPAPYTNLYGQELEVELVHHQRPEQKFASLEQLQEQVTRDLHTIRTLLGVANR